MNKTHKIQKILFTGGHLTPALAVLEELQSRGYTNFIWVGPKHNQTGNKATSAEYKSITELQIPFYNLQTGKLIRSFTVRQLPFVILNYVKLLIGFIQSLYILLRQRPKIIVSFGGYIAVPIVIVGKLLGAKVVTHEQTITVGLANKIIAKFANKICVSWEDSLVHFPKEKTVFTGNPLRIEILTHQPKSEITTFDNNLPILFITGGNQGAHEMNKRIFPIVEELLKHTNIIHQTGNSTVTKDYTKAQEIKFQLKPKQQAQYKVFDYLQSQKMAEALQNSNIVFSRAGANTVTELALLGKHSILMPIPWVSGNEQMLNAKYLEEHKLATIVEQKDDFTEEDLLQAILETLNKKLTPKPLDIPTNAQKLVADEVEKLVNNSM